MDEVIKYALTILCAVVVVEGHKRALPNNLSLSSYVRVSRTISPIRYKSVWRLLLGS